MKKEAYTTEDITRYLLGELTGAERDRFEEALVEAELLTQVEERENELIDDYVRGNLSGALRVRFEQRLATNPALRRRVGTAKVLLPSLNRPRSSQPESAMDWRQTLAAAWRNQLSALRLAWATALLLFFAGGTWMLQEIRRLRGEVNQLTAAQTIRSRRQQELEQQVATQREREDQLAAELEQWRTQSNGAPPQTTPVQTLFATLALTADGVSSGGTSATPRLTLTSAQQQLRLLLRTLPGQYPRYRATVLTAADLRPIWSADNLRPTNRTGSSFTLAIPASKLPAGEYVIKVEGIGADGDTFTVMNTNFVLSKQ